MSLRRFAPALALLCVFLVGTGPGSIADTTQIDFRGIFYRIPYAPAVADLNRDGWLDLFGAYNDTSGKFGQLFMPFPWQRDTRVADFNGDGVLDVVANTYTCTDALPTSVLYTGSINQAGQVSFTKKDNFPALKGRGETIVAADFDNDGDLDIYLPYYTFALTGTPNCNPTPNCANISHCYLLKNDGSANFTDVADAAGVSLRDLCALLRPEGAQAVDFNDDGLIDLYCASHLFINTGNMTFADRTNDYGLSALFEQAAASIGQLIGGGLFDEGMKFIDWDNDGHLDLVLHHPTKGPILFEFHGTQFTTWRRLASVDFSQSYGINTYDMDNDGREDLVMNGGVNCDSKIFLNKPAGFSIAPVRLCGGDAFTSLNQGQAGMAFGDINRDGKIDLLYPRYGAMTYFVNNTVGPQGSGSFSIEVLGPAGEQNQQGRVVRISPSDQPGVTYTRVVDSGSGLLAQNQYALLVGAPSSASYNVEVIFSNSHVGPFAISQGSTARVRQDGTVSITASPAGASIPPPQRPADTVGLYRPSAQTFYLRNTNTEGPPDTSVPYGANGDLPIVGDWDGNGTTTIGLYRPSNQTFYLRNSNTYGFADLIIRMGAPGDVPIAGDWDGDGTTTIGLYRPSTQTFYLRFSNTEGFPEITLPYGANGDIPLVGDWDGNGVSTIGVYRPSDHTFYLKNCNSYGFPDLIIPYGPTPVAPVVGDWNGDGCATIGVYGGTPQTFYLRNSNTIGLADLYIRFGAPGDVPLAGHWTGN